MATSIRLLYTGCQKRSATDIVRLAEFNDSFAEILVCAAELNQTAALLWVLVAEVGDPPTQFRVHLAELPVIRAPISGFSADVGNLYI